MKTYTFIFIFILILASCSNGGDHGFADCRIETIDISDPGDSTHILTQDEYYVDSICSLECPDENEFFQVSKFMVKNGRTYIMDSRVRRTVYVFDHQGHFLFKAGEKGRGRNEYLGDPVDFFVDNNNYLHVFDYDGQKILIFNEKGKVDRVISTRDQMVLTFGLTNDHRYMFAYNQKAKYNAALTMSSEDNKTIETIIPLTQDYCFTSDQQFFSNGNRLSHIPILADSILVYKESSLEKIVRVDFHGKFIMDEMPEVHTVNSIENIEKWKLYEGVDGIDGYQETDSLQYLSYTYRRRGYFWLNDKSRKRILRGQCLFVHKTLPLLYYYLQNNQIVTLSVPFYEREINPNEKSCAKVLYIRLK